ncbi:hypothetical protein [Thermosipho atlanticus]|uniref:Uncharacterized protein n=1 Tax=Thermosipho atlanticus DSM 15807 TaxID=1123380 RepID=A0A1M5ST48_9BACT|nr:hypothetical protein [Thermosipho atlanticus]SHH41617.1 hypothetical protein SAMN02745199_1064 [Thermosipho atlanticus DSM 15807]
MLSSKSLLFFLLLVSIFAFPQSNFDNFRKNLTTAKDFASLLEVPSEYYPEFVTGTSYFLDILDFSEGISYLKDGNYNKAFEYFSKVGVSNFIGLIPFVNTMVTVLNFAQPFWNKVISYVFDERISKYSNEFRKLKLEQLEKLLKKDPLAFNGEDFKNWITNDSIEIQDFISDVFDSMQHGLYNVGNKIMNEKEFESKPWYQKLKSLYINLNVKAYSYEDVKDFWLSMWRKSVFKEGMEIVLTRKKESIESFLNQSTVELYIKINKQKKDERQFSVQIPELSFEGALNNELHAYFDLIKFSSDYISVILLDSRKNIVFQKQYKVSELLQNYDPLLSSDYSMHYIKKIVITPKYQKNTIQKLTVELPKETKIATLTVAGTSTVITSSSFSFDNLILYFDDFLEIIAQTSTETIQYSSFIPTNGKVTLNEPLINKKPHFENAKDCKSYLLKLKNDFMNNLSDTQAPQILKKSINIAYNDIKTFTVEDPSLLNLINPQQLIGKDQRLNEEEKSFKQIESKVNDLKNKIDQLFYSQIYFKDLENMCLRTIIDDGVIPSYYKYILQKQKLLQSEIDSRKSLVSTLQNELSTILSEAEQSREMINNKIALDILFDTKLVPSYSKLISKIQELLNKTFIIEANLEKNENKINTLVKLFESKKELTIEKAEIYKIFLGKWHSLLKQRDSLEEKVKSYNPPDIEGFLKAIVSFDNINLYYLRHGNLTYEDYINGIQEKLPFSFRKDDLNDVISKVIDFVIQENNLNEEAKTMNNSLSKLKEQLLYYSKYYFLTTIKPEDLVLNEDFVILKVPNYNYSQFVEKFTYKSIGFSNKLNNVIYYLEKITKYIDDFYGEDPEGEKLLEKTKKLISMAHFSTIKEYNSMIFEWVKEYESELFFKIPLYNHLYINSGKNTKEIKVTSEKFLKSISQRNYKIQKYFLEDYQNPLNVLMKNLFTTMIYEIDVFYLKIKSEIDELNKMSKITKLREKKRIENELNKDIFSALNIEVPDYLKGIITHNYIYNYLSVADKWAQTCDNLRNYLQEVYKK